MGRIFEIRSKSVEGLTVEVGYGNNGCLTSIKINQEVTHEQLRKIFDGLCFTADELIKLYAKFPDMLTELHPELTFLDFWERYNHKFDKKRANDKWRTMKPADRQRAYDYIAEYEREIKKSGAAKMYAKTFLTNRVWEV